MTATVRNITIEQGASFTLTQPLGTDAHEGDTVTGKIRDAYGGTLLATFTGEIAAETLTLELTAEETAALTVPDGTADDLREVVIGVYDAESIDGDANVTRHLKGRVILDRKVST